MPRPTKPLGNNTIVIIRAPLVTDPRDNSLYRDWINAARVTVSRCMVEPMKLTEKLNQEDNRDREYSKTSVRAYVPFDTDVIHTDRMEFMGEIFDVFGHPATWFGFDGQITYRAFIAKIREG